MARNLIESRIMGLCKLLAVKDSDIRLLTLFQGDQAVDRGIHIGGAFSATVPLVSLFYGGFMDLDIGDPARPGQDMFVLSKGHTVATMASIFCDLGYFDPSILVNSRAMKSILNGHPGPLLPGVHISTGPLGQGLAVSAGFAMAGKRSPGFDVFCMTGDGELQEGIVWEAFMYAPQARLDNLCVLIDKNEGQLDDHTKLVFPMDNLAPQIASFGWRVLEADGTSYESVAAALSEFSSSPRGGRPTAIICSSRKGYGAFSASLDKHKVTLSKELYEQERIQQERRRDARIRELLSYRESLSAAGEGELLKALDSAALRMGLDTAGKEGSIGSRSPVIRTGKVPERDKTIVYDAGLLPRYPKDTQVMALDAVRKGMAVFAADPRVVSFDSDLSTTSGLLEGIASVDQTRGINVGIAESNMMCLGEAFSALGYNAWVSTFCPFFDWRVFRRIAVGSQEREESIASPDGWLSRGHGLDLTFLATAANLDTATNGATHMGNDDVIVYAGIAGLRIIDVSCPNQLVGIMRWIMEGNRGLIYLRIMRAASGVIYDPDFRFSFGTGYWAAGTPDARVVLVSSGRGVHECIAAAAMLNEKGVPASVMDMPSFDPQAARNLRKEGRFVLFAEQNNGFLWNQFLREGGYAGNDSVAGRCSAVNTAGADGTFRYIHSASYKELIREFGLAPEQITERVMAELGKGNERGTGAEKR